jgi:hypothetical protein
LPKPGAIWGYDSSMQTLGNAPLVYSLHAFYCWGRVPDILVVSCPIQRLIVRRRAHISLGSEKSMHRYSFNINVRKLIKG